MKFLSTLLATLMIGLTATQASAAVTYPKVVHDKQGRVLIVLVEKGKTCSYTYNQDGTVKSMSDPSCGDPNQWTTSATSN